MRGVLRDEGNKVALGGAASFALFVGALSGCLSDNHPTSLAEPIPGTQVTYRLSGGPYQEDGNASLELDFRGWATIIGPDWQPVTALIVDSKRLGKNHSTSDLIATRLAMDEEGRLLYVSTGCSRAENGCDGFSRRLSATESGNPILWGFSMLWGRAVPGHDLEVEVGGEVGDPKVVARLTWMGIEGGANIWRISVPAVFQNAYSGWGTFDAQFFVRPGDWLPFRAVIAPHSQSRWKSSLVVEEVSRIQQHVQHGVPNVENVAVVAQVNRGTWQNGFPAGLRDLAFRPDFHPHAAVQIAAKDPRVSAWFGNHPGYSLVAAYDNPRHFASAQAIAGTTYMQHQTHQVGLVFATSDGDSLRVAVHLDEQTGPGQVELLRQERVASVAEKKTKESPKPAEKWPSIANATAARALICEMGLMCGPTSYQFTLAWTDYKSGPADVMFYTFWKREPAPDSQVQGAGLNPQVQLFADSGRLAWSDVLLRNVESRFLGSFDYT